MSSQATVPIEGGAFVAVVGPSGAGKDAVMRHACEGLGNHPRIHFARRVITRPCDGGSELHDTLDEAGFEAAEAAGAFALTWRAHGLSYGLRAGVDGVIVAGDTVVANVSRRMIDAIRARYAHVLVVEITASPEILAARIAARGREAGSDAAGRLASASPTAEGPGVFRIDNGGPLAIAGERFGRLLTSLADPVSGG